MVETIKGMPVSEADVERWVREAEDGYDVATLRKKRRGRPGRGALPSQVVAVRFTPEELADIDKRAAATHTSRSDFIRSAVCA